MTMPQPYPVITAMLFPSVICFIPHAAAETTGQRQPCCFHRNDSLSVLFPIRWYPTSRDVMVSDGISSSRKVDYTVRCLTLRFLQGCDGAKLSGKGLLRTVRGIPSTTITVSCPEGRRNASNVVKLLTRQPQRCRTATSPPQG
ncbi:hypothetical protein BJX76DRAFT_336654 [Aspergillus varians]